MPLCAVHIQAQHGHAQAIPQVQTPRVPRAEPDWIVRFTKYLVYRRVGFPQAQIPRRDIKFLPRFSRPS